MITAFCSAVKCNMPFDYGRPFRHRPVRMRTKLIILYRVIHQIVFGIDCVLTPELGCDPLRVLEFRKTRILWKRDAIK